MWLAKKLDNSLLITSEAHFSSPIFMLSANYHVTTQILMQLAGILGLSNFFLAYLPQVPHEGTAAAMLTFYVLDQDELWLGFTDSSLAGGDALNLAVSQPTLAAEYHQYFQSLWTEHARPLKNGTSIIQAQVMNLTSLLDTVPWKNNDDREATLSLIQAFNARDEGSEG